MRVLLVSTLERGGPVEQTLLLAQGLRDLGVTVGVACAGDGLVARYATAGVAATPVPVRAGLDLRGAVRLGRLIGGADVVHAQDRRAGLWTRLAPGTRSAARIYTVHGLPDPYLPPPVGDASPGLRDRIAYELVEAGLARRSDALIFPSQALAEAFVERLRFPRERIVVVPNGVAPSPHPPGRGDRVGTLSLLEPVKDIPTFLRAAAIVHAHHPAVRFVVAGSGSEGEALMRLASEIGLGDIVDFPGFVDPGETMRGLSILVMPSVFENAPMSVLEAMAAGVPVVASRTGGIPELVGDHAELVRPGDVEGFASAIERMLENPGWAEAHARAAARRFEERFTGEANARATLGVYERVLADRRLGAALSCW